MMSEVKKTEQKAEIIRTMFEQSAANRQKVMVQTMPTNASIFDVIQQKNFMSTHHVKINSKLLDEQTAITSDIEEEKMDS